MRRPIAFTLVFLGGCLFGFFLRALLFREAPNLKDTELYELTRDLRPEEVYFFQPDDANKAVHFPMMGYLKSGTRFEIDWRYSRARYLIFRTVVDKEVIEQYARPVTVLGSDAGAARPTQSRGHGTTAPE